MKVVEFVKKVNKDDAKISPDEILTMATGLLDTVIVIGLDTNGELFFSSNIESKPEIIYQLEQLKFDVLAGDFDYED